MLPCPHPASRDIWNSHHYEPDAVHAVRDGLEAGCDIDSGSTYKDNLEPAVSSGLVNKSFSDAALFRSYRTRYQLGLFDPNVSNAYKKISTAEVGMASSQAVSEQASRKVYMCIFKMHMTCTSCRLGSYMTSADVA